MRPAESLVMADSDHPAGLDHDGADHWIRLNATEAAGSLGQGPGHPGLIEVDPHCGALVRTGPD